MNHPVRISDIPGRTQFSRLTSLISEIPIEATQLGTRYYDSLCKQNPTRVRLTRRAISLKIQSPFPHAELFHCLVYFSDQFSPLCVLLKK